MRRRKKQPRTCPLCDGVIDRRTRGRPVELLAGKWWHSGCLALLVTVESLAAAHNILNPSKENPRE